MSPFKLLLRYPRTQFEKLLKVIRGYPLITPSLGSMTLGKDDVKIARRLLKDLKRWENRKVVPEYETKFAQWNGSKYAYAFMGGRVALSSCIYALNLQKGDEVIIPGYTCVVVPNAFKFEGIIVVYVDIELDTYGIDVQKIENKITPKTKAIMLHHLYGLVCRDYEAIINLAKNYDLKVIEDCAHSTGAEFKGKKVGNWGDVSFYSSEQSKIFNTIQGGIAVTNSEQLAKRMSEYYKNAPYPDKGWVRKQLINVLLLYFRFSDPQRWWKGYIAELLFGSHKLISTTKEEENGVKPAYYGCKMPAPIAEIGINQLKKIDECNNKRREAAKKWDQWCDEKGYRKPLVVDESTPVYLRYPVLVEEEKKRDLRWGYQELGVTLGVWFVSNIHPVKVALTNCTNAKKAIACCVNLPCLE